MYAVTVTVTRKAHSLREGTVNSKKRLKSESESYLTRTTTVTVTVTGYLFYQRNSKENEQPIPANKGVADSYVPARLADAVNLF